MGHPKPFVGHPKPFDVVAVLQPIIPEALQLTEECYDLSAGLAAGQWAPWSKSSRGPPSL